MRVFLFTLIMTASLSFSSLSYATGINVVDLTTGSNNINTSSGRSDWGCRTHPFRTNPDGTPAVKFHKGVDICRGCATGTTIASTISGTVTRSDNRDSTGYGNRICVTNATMRVCDSHANTRDVQVGDTVTAGQRLGGVGSSGGSTGNHIDRETYLRNPTTGRYQLVDPALVMAAAAAGRDPQLSSVAADIIAESEAKTANEDCSAPENATGDNPYGNAAGQQCDPAMFSIADQLSMLYTNMANQSINDLITQPTSVAQMSCIDQLSAKYAEDIGSQFGNSIGLGASSNFPDIVQDSFLGIVADNFLGGALSGVQEAINTGLANTISSVANSILPGLGGGLGNLFGGGADFDCKLMKTIWDTIQCLEFPEIPKLFDLDFGGSFLSRPDSCEGQALYDTALDMLNNSGVANSMTEWSAEQSQELNRSIRCSVASGSDCQ